MNYQQQSLNGLNNINADEITSNNITTETIDVSDLFTTQNAGVKYRNINTALDTSKNINTLSKNINIKNINIKNISINIRYSIVRKY
jgi:hypothetical protein